MRKKNITILGISIGTRSIGIAVFRNNELIDWYIKSFRQMWSSKKLTAILDFLEQLIIDNNPTTIALKTLQLDVESKSTEKIMNGLSVIAKQHGVTVRRYTLRQLKQFHLKTSAATRARLIEHIVQEYSCVSNEYHKEQKIKNHYYLKMFEAIAVGSMCVYQL